MPTPAAECPNLHEDIPRLDLECWARALVHVLETLCSEAAFPVPDSGWSPWVRRYEGDAIDTHHLWIQKSITMVNRTITKQLSAALLYTFTLQAGLQIPHSWKWPSRRQGHDVVQRGLGSILQPDQRDQKNGLFEKAFPIGMGQKDVSALGSCLDGPRE